MAKVMPRLSGIATSKTAGNGSRSSPTATNTAASTTTPTRSRLFNSGIIIRNTTASSSPTAAAGTVAVAPQESFVPCGIVAEPSAAERPRGIAALRESLTEIGWTPSESRAANGEAEGEQEYE